MISDPCDTGSIIAVLIMLVVILSGPAALVLAVLT